MITHDAQKRGAETNHKRALERDQTVLTLLEVGCSYAEISKILDIKLTTLPTVILRARRRAGIGPAR